MIAYLMCSIIFSVVYYVQAFKTGLSAKNWALAGLILGPMLYPLFRSRQRIKLIRARGLHTAFLIA